MSSPNIISTKFLRPRSSGFFLFSLLFLVALAPILFLFPQNVYALDITLAWDANSEEDLAGYRIYCRQEGESYDYNDPAWEVDKAETSCTIYNLDNHTTYCFVARAFDTSGNESADSNEVCYQASENNAPAANAGPDQTVNEGATVTLDGSNSTDPDGNIESYLWTQTAGTSVTLSDAGEVQTTFTAPSVGGGGEALIFRLEVTDDGGLKDTDTAIINISNVNQAPTADAGPDQTVNEGATVTLSGSNSSDPDGSIASYQWTRTEGTAVTLSDPASATPTFTAPLVSAGSEALSFQLTVTDNGGLSGTDTVIINVSNVNQAPTADAGLDQTVDEGDTATLDGSNSYDPDGTIVTYEWTQTRGTAVTLSNASEVQPAFTVPSVGGGGEALIFRLEVTDDGGLKDTDSAIINISNVNQAPTADAGRDQTVDEGDTVTLDGSNSYDADGTIATYTWTQMAGTSVTLSDATAAQPTFTAPDIGPDGDLLTFQLTITDDGGLQSTDACIVNVSWVNDSPILTSLSIGGATSVIENTTANYTATAAFSDGTTKTVTDSASWSEDSSSASINSSGVVSTSEVTTDQTVTITASYTFGDVTETAQKVVTIVDVPASNLAPMNPVITSPYDGQMECDLLTHITTEPFSDPDSDLHGQSRWQISEQEDFSSLILDTTSTERLTELTVPHMLLEGDTTYYVRVRFYDIYPEPSDWSDAIEFTTTADVNDVNLNGIPDEQEVNAEVDLNGDGTYDSEQPGVIKCVQSEIGNVTIGVSKASDSITSIEALETIDPSTISDKIKRPKKFLLGLFSYRLSVNKPGATATVRVYFSKDISKARTFFKYDTINGWQDYSQHTTFGEDGRSITLEVKDGGYGDSDGIANGIILDPGGLAAGSTSGGGGGSDSDGCFIATAAFGSYAEPHVKLLRDFRDQHLLRNMPGRWFVRMYYRYSPFWADLINTHSWCKPIVRLALMPLVGISYVLIKASMVTSILAGLMLVLFVLGCFLRMHGRPVTGGKQ